MNELIGALITIITLTCLAIQAYGIKRGKYDSSMAAWVIWTCIFIFLFVIYHEDGKWTAIDLFLGIQTIGHFGMIWLTYKYVPKKFYPEDWILLSVAIVGFIIWIVAYFYGGNLLNAILIGILGQTIADAIGAVFYIKIVIAKPFRQPLSAWIINSFLYPITAYGIYLGKEEWTAYLFIGYAFVMYNTLLIVLIWQRRKKKYIELDYHK